MGADVTYSGTVGAAFEAALRGRPALAFSVEAREPGWLDEAAPRAARHGRARASRAACRATASSTSICPDRPLAAIAGIRPARLGGASCHDRVFLGGDGDGARRSPAST